MRFILEMDYSPVNRVFSWLSVKNLLPLTSSWSLDVIVQSLSHIQLFWPHGLQHARFPCPSLSPGIYTNSCPLSQWCHPTISSSVAPSPPNLNLSEHQSLFQWIGSSHQVAKALELQHQCFQWIFRVDSFRMYDITCLVDKSCQTCCDPIDCSLPGSSVLGISQARILEWIAISFSIWHYLLR